MTQPFSDAPTDGNDGHRPPSGGRKLSDVPSWFAVAAAALIVATFAIVVVLLVRDDTTTIEATDSTTTLSETTTSTVMTTTTAESTTLTSEPTTSSRATTTASSTTGSTSTAPGSTATVPAELSPAVWPWFNSTTRYTDPVEAATEFVVDFIGFGEPIAGPFQQGDSRSGEVEIQPAQGGPITTIFVRQLGTDGTWWVLGAATATIVVDEPSALCTIESPLTVQGEAFTFEGTVEVQVRADDAVGPLAVVPVTGGGTKLEPFEGDITFQMPASDSGAVVFLSRSAEDGSVSEASVVRVSFVPSDC